MTALPDRTNIVLTGFMGTGKTAVGQELATRLQRPFMDMDDCIAARAGCAIAEVFARQGEAAFRRLEQAVCQELAAQSNLVMATGGGTWMNARNRALLSRTGFVICLRASPEHILERIAAESHRPLLESATQSRAARVQSLLAERAVHYNAIPMQIDTSGLSIPEVATAVQRILPQCSSSDI